MTDHDDFAIGQLGTLLRERVRDVHPDLAARASIALRAGSRIRRRRRLTVASATLASVAAVTVLGAQLWPTASTTVHGSFTATPSLSPSAPGDPADCLPSLDYTKMDGAPANAVPPKSVRQLTSMSVAGLPSRDRQPAPCPGPNAEVQHLPVSLNAPGWTCDPPADDKFVCGGGASSVLVTLRPATFHDDYLKNPDKASPDQFVSDVHGGFFATIRVVSGHTSPGQLAKYLAWG